MWSGDGRDVRILTNSLAANDVAAVHGGYSRHRKELLEGGVQIWELKPLPGTQNTASLFGSSGASLHTKAFAVDGRGALRRQLQPRSPLDLVELRARRVRAERAARAAARADIRQTDSERPRVARLPRRGQVALDRWPRKPRPRAPCFMGASIPGLARPYAPPRRAVLCTGCQRGLSAGYPRRSPAGCRPDRGRTSCDVPSADRSTARRS